MTHKKASLNFCIIPSIQICSVIMTMYSQQQEQIIKEHQRLAPCVEFSAVGFDHHSEAGSYGSLNTFSTASSTNSNLSGWGSAVSRKSYACLKTLGETEERKMETTKKALPRQPRAIEGDSWGYFVDTPEC